MRSRAAVWEGTRTVGFLALPLVAFGLIGPGLWPLYVAWLAVALPCGVWFGTRHYIRWGRDEWRRAREPALRPVSVARWRARGLRHERATDLAGRAFTLKLRQRATGLAATLTGPGGAERVVLPHWFRQPVWLRRELERGHRLTGELVTAKARVPLGFSLTGREISMWLGWHTRYEVTSQAVRLGERRLAVRDTLGWRVASDLTEEEATLCALVLLTGLADPW